jgi:hypothetical protein
MHYISHYVVTITRHSGKNAKGDKCVLTIITGRAGKKKSSQIGLKLRESLVSYAAMLLKSTACEDWHQGSIPTSQRTHSVSIRKTNQLMMIREIVYCGCYTKECNQVGELQHFLMWSLVAHIVTSELLLKCWTKFMRSSVPCLMSCQVSVLTVSTRWTHDFEKSGAAKRVIWWLVKCVSKFLWITRPCVNGDVNNRGIF